MAKTCNGAIDEVLYRLNVQAPLENGMLKDAFRAILNDDEIRSRDIQMGSLLTGIMSRGPSLDEVITLLDCVFEVDGFDPRKREKIILPNNEKLISLIGCGKKGFKTMNVSTPALIVASSIGTYAAKAVSCSTSSVTGSADFMRECGVNTDISIDNMKDIVKKVGIGIFGIEQLIPKFDKKYGGKFYAPHTLSFGLAALVSPIQYDNLLYGLAHPNVELSLNVLKHFGVSNAMVVSTTNDNIHYLDEFGIYGKTTLIGMKNGVFGKKIAFNPTSKLKLPRYIPADIEQGSSIYENIKYGIDVLCGKGEKAREDVICINSGTALYLAGKCENLKEGYVLSKKEIQTNRPIEKLLELIKETNGDKTKLYTYLG